MSNLTPPENNVSATDTRLMSTGLIIGLVLISLFSFSALIGLSGYADDIHDKNNGQAHALSNSAIGFVGLRQLLDDTGRTTFLDSNKAGRFAKYDLRIYTLNSTFQTDILDELNPDSPKLIILPKWNVMPLPKSSGWVQKSPYAEVQNNDILSSNLKALAGEIKLSQAEGDDATAAKTYQFRLNETTSTYKNRFTRLQTLSGENLDPVVKSGSDKVILAKIKDSQTYILSDPDFLNTAGLKTRSGARFALDILTFIASESLTERFVFDLAIHGIGGRQNMIKLFTKPPFLGITVLMLTLLGLMAWQAFLRFGDAKAGPSEEFGEDLHMGPQSLTRTTAEFLAIARREASVTDDYTALVRKQVLEQLHLPGRDAASRDAALDRREITKGLKPQFSEINQQAQTAKTRKYMLDTAKAVQDWKKDISS